MKRLNLGRYAFCTCVVVALLAGCSGLQPPIGGPGAFPQGPALGPPHLVSQNKPSSYRAIYDFRKRHGADPAAGLIDVDGILYGTTPYGGATRPCGNYLCGTAFSLTKDGAEKVLHDFGKGTDGFNPRSGLIDVGGTLYGTTADGGANGHGTVFSLRTTGAEKVLYSFKGGSDGAHPLGALLNVGGTLYGTTSQGGAACNSSQGCGTVFSVSATGAETVIYRFKSSHRDGINPQAGLIDVNGTLYGTTVAGGYGYGTVFAIAADGAEHVLYRFDKYNRPYDGWAPDASLIDVNGALYGTTILGGVNGQGMIFSVSLTGKEHVLYNFVGGNDDGSNPYASLIDVNGTLYGTTAYGGPHDGTVFSISTGGKERVLHKFGSGDDGEEPKAGLVNVDGTLYGTTTLGGTHESPPGLGTAFALTLPH
jgi:uncharacterized repeat protein (TIGR03803 family)